MLMLIQYEQINKIIQHVCKTVNYNSQKGLLLSEVHINFNQNLKEDGSFKFEKGDEIYRKNIIVIQYKVKQFK